VSAIAPKIKKKSAKDAAGCKEGCCGEDAGARGKSQQGKSYLRRYGLLRQQDATNSAATRSKSKAVAVGDGVEMTAKGASLKLFDQRRLKGKERDLEAGDGESSQTSDSMLEWGVDVSSKVIGESIMNAAAEVAVECCRLCLEADECCRQLCCAALCCLQELKASLATGNTSGSSLENKVLSPCLEDDVVFVAALVADHSSCAATCSFDRPTDYGASESERAGLC
jgi:hypothetical protein